jgi:hypothetical protein
MTDENGTNMTTINDQQRELAQQQPQPDPRVAQANRARARENGNRIAAIADIAEENLETADAERLGRSRYEDGFQVLRWLVGADWHERTVDGDRVLHDEHGSLDPARVCEFIDLILSGHSSLEARNAMRDAQKHAAHAEATRRAAAEARELAGGMHRFADGPLVPAQRPAAPALPAGPVPSSGERLPRREPIAPPVPSEVEPVEHVDEDQAWSTSQMLQVLKDETAGGAEKVLKPQSIQALHDGGYGRKQPERDAPSFGPSPDPRFGASALPQTQYLPRVDQPTQVFSPFFGDDVQSEPAVDDAQEPRPFQVPRYAPEATDGPAESPAKAKVASEAGNAAGNEASDDDES